VKILKKRFGALIYDWPRFVGCTVFSNGWKNMRNRQDVLLSDPENSGVTCDWEFTRPLHLCNVFPITGKWLLRRAMKSCPIRFAEPPGKESPEGNPPKVSFIIGHRGVERLPLLLMTLQSIAAQEDVSFECIVVEQDAEPLIRDALPGWVRYLYTPLFDPDQPYNRSKTFNDGVQLAQGNVLILHDNDMVIPVCYAATARDLFEKGYEVSQLKRFIFYLNETSTQTVVSEGDIPENVHCEQVIENACGGGSLAISKEVYWEIGGMDEEFIGWGGEDTEFWDRCLTRKVWGYAMLPIVHLWHASQPSKRAVNGNGALTAELADRRRAMPARERIRELMMRNKQENGDIK